MLLFLIFTSRISGAGLLLPNSPILNSSSGLIFLCPTPAGSTYNPAYSHSALEMGITYLYSDRELPYYFLNLSYKKKNIGLSCNANHLGHPLYKESSVNVSANYQFSNISIGTALRLQNYDVKNYSNDSAVLLDSGIIWSTNTLTTGFSLLNLTKTQVSGIALPVCYLFEMNYKLMDNASVSFGIEKEYDYHFDYKAGAYYRLHKILALIASYHHNPIGIGAGLQFSPHYFHLNYGIMTHQYLDITHSISISYDFD